MQYREFTVTGRVYSGSADHAKHRVFWAISDSEYEDEFLIDKIVIEGENDSNQ